MSLYEHFYFQLLQDHNGIQIYFNDYINEYYINMNVLCTHYSFRENDTQLSNTY